MSPCTKPIASSGKNQWVCCLNAQASRDRCRDIRAIVDLTGVEAAAGLRRPIMVSTPPGVTYVHLQPLEVEVIFPTKEPARANADPDRSRNSL